MVFVTMGQHDRGDMVAILLQKIEVRNTNVDAVRRFFGEAHAGVENEHFILITHSHAIHSKLADTAERNDLHHTTHYRLFLNSPEAWAVLNFRAAIVGL